jgi:hypothetical protein
MTGMGFKYIQIYLPIQNQNQIVLEGVIRAQMIFFLLYQAGTKISYAHVSFTRHEEGRLYFTDFSEL